MSNLQKFPSKISISTFIPVTAGIIVAGVGLGANASSLQAGIAGLATGISGATTAVLATNKKNERIRLLEQQINGQNISSAIDELKERKKLIVQDITNIKTHRDESERIAGELEVRQAKQEALAKEIVNLQSERQNLENRVAAINANNPTLENLEKRQREVSKLQESIQQLEGKQEVYQQKISEMEEKKSRLQEMEAIFFRHQAEIQGISEEIKQGRAIVQDLNRKAVELEFLRNTYDVLESEKQAYESRREHLQAEVLRLETEKNRILSEIKELESRAQESERLRAEIADLRIQHRTAEGKLREINREIEQLEINRDNLANEVARKEAEIFRKNQQLVELERRIRELKQEIVDIENSAKVALQVLEKPILGLVNVRLKDIDENNFLVAFSKFLQNKGLNFHERIVKAFHTSLKVQDISALVVLAGISGTGKSELPQKYADFIGAPLVMLPVQPRWDSPQDLQGFYNYIEKKYKPTELMHYLYQYQQDPKMEGRIILVLLDEMNLARVEYYFSDFLSKLETRRSKDTYLPLDVGSLNLEPKQCEILIPQEFLFIGTMNEDETTQSLSDKVLDRANVLTFGRPQELKLRGPKIEHQPANHYLPWSEFVKWTKDPDPNSNVVREVKEFVDRANDIMEKLGHPFAHRVYQAIAKYVVNYPGVGDPQIRKQAIADQFGQKILPKLRGVRIEEAGPELDKMGLLIDELGDEALKTAFDRAKKGRYGQFQWKGMVYSDQEIS